MHSEFLAVARGEAPARRVLQNGRIVNVFSGRIEEADIAIFEGRIAGVGTGYRAEEMVDLDGAFVAPGLIDAHVHIESSLCTPPQFASAVLPLGITTVVTDPHEIANVAGMDGIRYMVQSSQNLPLRVVIMASSCVPATHMETSGAQLDDEDLYQLLAEGAVHGLAEVMNFPGVIHGDPTVLAKLHAFRGRPQDGHAPGVRGAQLNAYVAAGIGSDHECIDVDEAAEKLARGLYIFIREATNAHNLHALLPLITPANSRRICFCTDDRMPGDLLDQGSIDYMVREAIAFGVDPVDAFRMATLNPAEYFGLPDRGAIAPGRWADLLVFDALDAPRARQVYVAGECVAQSGTLSSPGRIAGSAPHAAAVTGTVHVNVDALDLRVAAQAGQRVRCIGALDGQLVTEERIVELPVRNGCALADPGQDVLKMAVIERHHPKTAGDSGPVGIGFIQGFGLGRGAIAGTVAHDHHNVVVIGADDASMRAAVRAVVEMRGGLAVFDGEGIVADLPLPIGGLMSDRPVAHVRTGYDALLAAAARLGSTLHDPFMAMSFMALEVIPRLKLTDQGLVDVARFEIVDLFV